MRSALVVGVLSGVLVLLPAAALAHGGYHWTERKAERVLFRDDLLNNGRRVIIVADVACDGFGHNFRAWNGYRVYSKFTCTVQTPRDRLRCVEIALKGPRSPYTFLWHLVDRYWCGY